MRLRCAPLVVCLFGLALAAPTASAKALAKRPSELVTSPSDRALLLEAQQSMALLKRSKKLTQQRAEWDKVVAKFRRVVLKYPQSGLADDALLAAAELLREMAARFKAKHYKDDALLAYQKLADEYPRSKLGEPALFAAFEIAGESGDRKRIGDAARRYLETYPDGKQAAEVKAALRKRERAAAAERPLPAQPPAGVAHVLGLRFWSGETSTRVVLDVDKELTVKWDRLSKPDRLFVDLPGARLHPNLEDRHYPVGDGLLERVRIAQNQDQVVRVVLDFKSVREQRIFYLRDPLRLVIDVHGDKPAAAAQPARAVSAATRPVRDEPEQAVRITDEQPVPEVEPEEILVSRRIAGMAAPDPRPTTPAAPRTAPRILLEGTGARPDRKAASGPPPAPAAPTANRSGQYSLARQLGLQARRIVIDAGHGGHDPGTIGRAGLQEKDLVLDVALRLERMVREQLGAEVVMTRASDVFIPLEERTAIANAKGADLFLSVHANSSPNPRARGVETYFLNFAKDSHAETVAARENAISQATLKDLQNLVKAIALNSKIDESRDFATEVQEALVTSLTALDPSLPDRGVHTAPFYVLIGANMPSILAEIAFVSHASEEKRLKTAAHRETIARSLFHGVARYLDALNRTASLPLTAGAGRTRVAGKSSAR